MKPKIHTTHLDANTRLYQLAELNIDIFSEVSKAGHRAFLSCPPYAPPTTAGTNAWSETVISLRQQVLRLKTWRYDNPSNLPLTINDKHKISITVSSGDDATGVPHLTPTTKSYKGVKTEEMVQANKQFDFFPDHISEHIQLRPKTLKYPNWVLLIFATPVQIRSELSYPSEISNGKISKWQERILLPTIDTNDKIEDQSPSDLGPILDFEVMRR